MGRRSRVPIDERHPLQGQSPYAATKIAADALGESYHRAFGLPVTILRPFNTFGPRQSARAIIPAIISQALARDVVKLGRLDPRRDLTFVKDTVSGFVAIAGCDAAVGRAVNIGRGEDISIGELVETIGRRLGRSLKVETDQDRLRPAASEVERLLAGTALAQSLWGWKPQYTLEQGLDETIDWVRAHLEPFPSRIVRDLNGFPPRGKCPGCQSSPNVGTLIFLTTSADWPLPATEVTDRCRSRR